MVTEHVGVKLGLGASCFYKGVSPTQIQDPIFVEVFLIPAIMYAKGAFDGLNFHNINLRILLQVKMAVSSAGFHQHQCPTGTGL